MRTIAEDRITSKRIEDNRKKKKLKYDNFEYLFLMIRKYVFSASRHNTAGYGHTKFQVEDVISEVYLLCIENNKSFTEIVVKSLIYKAFYETCKKFNVETYDKKYLSEWRDGNKTSIAKIDRKASQKRKENLTDTYIKILLRQKGFSKEQLEHATELIKQKREEIIKKRLILNSKPNKYIKVTGEFHYKKQQAEELIDITSLVNSMVSCRDFSNNSPLIRKYYYEIY